ncbi:MAG: type II secretion system protein GspJ [Burkholderiales bacterium RIFCSPLOWO2_12_67_14]|nr:MAG: type II secretion system protein GspJ [Burkholderiales bacterium RIFCSPLOWO2_12_67_14]
MRRARGFTLLELLIAIALFALLGLATYRMLDSVLQTDNSTRAHEQQLRELVRAIAAREVNRQYLALAHGRWQGVAEQAVDQPIGRDVHNRLRMAVVRSESTTGKPAQTTMRLLDGTEQACLVACKLHTGRTHQIRVHMAWLGHPLVGDTLYGGKPLWGMARQALHATRLRLLHPTQGRALDFLIPPPADFLQLLTETGLHYNESQLG